MIYKKWIVAFCFLVAPIASNAKLLLVDSSLNDTLASFAVLTGNTYVAAVEINEKFNLNLNNITPDQAHQKLQDLLKANGLQLISTSDKTYKVVKSTASVVEDSAAVITKKIFIGNGLSQRAIEQLVAANPKLAKLKLVSSGVSDKEVIAIGTAAQLGQLQALVADLSGASKKTAKKIDTASVSNIPQTSGVTTKLIDLKYADATSVGKTLQQLFSNQQMPLSYAMHEDANQIILAGDKDLVDEASRVIEGMDRKPRQVYVDAIIAEVSDSAGKQLGAQLAGSGSNLGLAYSNSTDAGSLGNINNSTALQNISGGLVALGKGAGVIPDLGVILSVLEEDGDTRILATPSIMTTENKESEILVGQNVPFLTGQYVNSGSTTNSNPFQTIERKDLGTMLRIKPRISAQGQISLDIKQEVSRIDSTTSGLSDVATIKREISTTVNLYSGETIAIGGLRDKQEEVTESRIPLVGDLPILGYLFRQESKRTVGRNLMIFLKPSLVSDVSERRALLNEKAEDVKSVVEFKLD